MDPETVSLIFILVFWMYLIALATRTHRQLKNAYDEQYNL